MIASLLAKYLNYEFVFLQMLTAAIMKRMFALCLFGLVFFLPFGCAGGKKLGLNDFICLFLFVPQKVYFGFVFLLNSHEVYAKWNSCPCLQSSTVQRYPQTL